MQKNFRKVSGEILEVNGKTSNEKTATSGNNTSKATATFSCKITTNNVIHNVSISCNYKGTDS